MLESRHLVGLFLGVVVLCCVFFTLGYVMGNSQESSARVMAAANEAKPMPDTAAKPDATQPPVPAPSEWSFPSTAEPAKPAAQIQPVKPSVELNPPAGASRPSAIGSAPASKPVGLTPKSNTAPPRIAKGSILLQVAALTRESDALVLAHALQRKNFPAFVATPAGDHYYRVQVGPYADKESADLTRRALLKEGFKAIIKR